MDVNVPPDSRTARLPRPLQPPAVIAHRGHMEARARLVGDRTSPPAHVFEADGLETLSDMEAGRFAFVQMDLNLAKPTQVALDYVYPRLNPGAIIVFDDHGGAGLETQRAAVGSSSPSGPGSSWHCQADRE